ncbi:MAG: glycosyltransferase family 4 protein [Reyranella sp.]|uniref:glycosyltransferase family 4 protein n=1 Tax=Reyranella sp. TaxID=1929291 RepID=UPI003D0D7782
MTLWLDVDDFFYFAQRSARPTGIQRLTGEVYCAFAEQAPDRVRFVTHNERPGLFKLIDWQEVHDTYRNMTSGSAASPPAPPAAAVEPQLADVATPTAPSSLMARLRSWMFPPPPAMPQPEQPQPPPAATRIEDLRDVGRAGDVLCALGAPWHDGNYATRVRELTGRTGMRFAMLVHDLIPLVRPEYFELGRGPEFGKVMRETLPLADAILTNSRSTARDVAAWTAGQGIALKCQPRAVPIGTGFARPQPGSLPEPLSPGGFVLFVSTIETRKNHQQAFRVWCRMLRDLPRETVPTLVFAGSVGWMVDDLMKAIEATRWLDGKLVFIRSPDDATLSALYRDCRFTLFLSHYEGWGLPVSDSLSFGKICVSSDRTSMPEAGGPFCLYVDPDDTTGAYQAIRRLIEHPDELARLEHRLRTDFAPVGWSATADAILAATLDAAPRRRCISIPPP